MHGEIDTSAHTSDDMPLIDEIRSGLKQSIETAHNVRRLAQLHDAAESSAHAGMILGHLEQLSRIANVPNDEKRPVEFGRYFEEDEEAPGRRAAMESLLCTRRRPENAKALCSTLPTTTEGTDRVILTFTLAAMGSLASVPEALASRQTEPTSSDLSESKRP